MNYYNLLTLDGKAVIDNAEICRYNENGYRAVFKLDLSARGILIQNIIKIQDRHADNALFYQIRKCLNISEEQDENVLLESIIFVDFDTLFRSDGIDEEDVQLFDNTKEELTGKKGDIYTMSLT